MDRPIGQWTDPVNGQTRSSVAVASLMLSRLDYGNVTLAGIPSYLLQQLQSVMNAATQLIYSTSKYEHVTAAQPTPLAQRPTAEDPSLLTVISHTTVNCPRSDWSLWILQSVRSFLHSFTYVSIVGWSVQSFYHCTSISWTNRQNCCNMTCYANWWHVTIRHNFVCRWPANTNAIVNEQAIAMKKERVIQIFCYIMCNWLCILQQMNFVMLRHI